MESTGIIFICPLAARPEIKSATSAIDTGVLPLAVEAMFATKLKTE